MAQSETWPLEELTGRWRRVQAEMAKTGLDGLMLSEATNFLYMTGHESTQYLHRMRPLVFLLPQRGDPVLIVYGVEGARLSYLSSAATIRSYADAPFPVADLVAAMRGLGWARGVIGAELGNNQRLGLPVLDYLQAQRELPGAVWQDGGPAIMAVQLLKSDEEVRVMRRACEVSEQAWEMLLKRIHPGVSAAEIRHQLALAIIEAGADPSRPFSAHITQLSRGARDGVFRTGDMLKLDVHSRYRGYWSDLCRLAVFGEPTAEHIEWHRRAHKLLADCIERVRPGARVTDVPSLANSELVAMGQEPLSGMTRIGHGIGLEATMPPSLNMLEESRFQPGMMVAVEPRYNSEMGLMMLEESVLVTDTGNRLLTTGAHVLGVVR